MTSRSNRNQSWIVVSVLAVVAAAYAYLFYLPTNWRIAEMKGELAEAETHAAGTVPMVAAIGATQRQLDELTAFVDAWENAAPSEHELAGLFERIHELTRLAETETIRFEPQSPIAYETFLRVPVVMECRGSFAQLTAVLAGLENMREPLWINRVDLHSTGEDGEVARAEISLDVFADNLDDSDQENLPGEPITQEADRHSVRL